MKPSLLPSCLLAASLAPCGAAVLANYDLTAITDPNETTETFLSASIDTEPLSSASDLTSPSTHNSGAVNPEFGDAFDNGGNQAVGWGARSNNPANGFAIVSPIDTYFSFDVAAGAGATIDFTTLTVLTGVNSTLGGFTANDYTLSYSLDGSSFLAAGTVLGGTNPGEAARVTGAGLATATISYDLSGVAALQGVTGTAYFQLDPVATSGSGQNGVITQRGGFIDDLVISGTVVPEPGTSLLGLLGLAGLLRRRR